MRYYKVADGTTPNLYEVRMQLPEVGIPEGANIEEHGYYILNETARPAAQVNHKVVETYEEANGVWSTVYTQVELTVQEIAAAKKARVPKAVTMRQARLALLNTGKLTAVNTAIAGMAGTAGEAARIEWEFSQEVQRTKPLVAALAPVLGLTEDQLDDLFIYAATIT